MANRRFTSQFDFSFEKMPVSLMGNFTQSGSAGAFATLLNNGITWTAVTMGSAGNSITVALVSGGTAGAEVVTVTGTAISVQIQSGVSTRTQVLTAVQASTAASALVSISVASGGTAATLLAATPLASGVDTVFIANIGLGNPMILTQIGTGLYQLALGNQAFKALLDCSIMLKRASGAVDLIAQLASDSVSASSPLITFRMLATATPTNLADADALYIRLGIRNE